MGKQPVTATKKSKAQISKAAQARKGARKKWTKSKAKEKANHAVFLEKEGLNKAINDVLGRGRIITISSIVDTLKVNGSVARGLVNLLLEQGLIAVQEPHSKQVIAVATPAGLARRDAKKDAGKEGGAEKKQPTEKKAAGDKAKK